MPAKFISELIRPIFDNAATTTITVGEPIIPNAFQWRGETYPVLEVLEFWRETSPCSHGSKEKYVRKHCYKFRTSDGQQMQVYFLRQAQRGASVKSRWFLYTCGEPPLAGSRDQD